MQGKPFSRFELVTDEVELSGLGRGEADAAIPRLNRVNLAGILWKAFVFKRPNRLWKVTTRKFSYYYTLIIVAVGSETKEDRE